MNFYIDTNVLLDLLMLREPYAGTATALFNLSATDQVNLYTSTHCIATSHYICKKLFDEPSLRKILAEVMDLLHIVAIDESILRKSLKSSHKDFEDAIQIFCAHQIKDMDGIITRNLKDFSTAEIKVFSPDDALNFILKK